VKYDAWVAEILNVETTPCVVPFPGNLENTTRPNYTYTLALESTAGKDHPSIVKPSVIVITSAEKLSWRLGQNVTIDVKELEPEFEKALDNTSQT